MVVAGTWLLTTGGFAGIGRCSSLLQRGHIRPIVLFVAQSLLTKEVLFLSRYRIVLQKRLFPPPAGIVLRGILVTVRFSGNRAGVPRGSSALPLVDKDGVILDSIRFLVGKLVFGHSRAFLITGIYQQGSNEAAGQGSTARLAPEFGGMISRSSAPQHCSEAIFPEPGAQPEAPVTVLFVPAIGLIVCRLPVDGCIPASAITEDS